MEKELSVIYVNYNAGNYLKASIESLIKTVKEVDYEIIVVDNASTDNSAEMIKKEFPEVLLINNANEGFAKGNNRGVKVAKGKYLLFLNCDTVVYPETINIMVSFIKQHKDAGAVTCKLEVPGMGIDYASHRGFPTPWNSFCYFTGLSKLFPKLKIFNGYTLSFMDMTKTHKIDSLSGAFMLVRREAGEQVGWWDEDYFFNGEDIDFCFCLKQKGWQIYYVPVVSILHYGGVSGGTKKHSQNITTADKETKKRIQTARFEAMEIFYNKHYKDKYPKLLTWLVLQGITLKQQQVFRKI